MKYRWRFEHNRWMLHGKHWVWGKFNLKKICFLYKKSPKIFVVFGHVLVPNQTEDRLPQATDEGNLKEALVGYPKPIDSLLVRYLVRFNFLQVLLVIWFVYVFIIICYLFNVICLINYMDFVHCYYCILFF